LNEIYLKKIEKNTEKFDSLAGDKLDFDQNGWISADVISQ
jgi:hypothetical protein